MLLAAAITVALVLPTATAASEAALDAGKTLTIVDRLRAQGEYDAAATELRGWIERWNSGSIQDPSFHSQVDRMNQLMRKMVEMEELLQRAPASPDAARALLRHVIDPARPTTRTAEQVRALQLMSRHDDDVKMLVNAAFPARLSIEIDAPLMHDPNLLAFPLESALVELSRDGFPIVRGASAGASEIRVRVSMRENDTSRSYLFAGTSMKSYAMHMTAEVVAPDGEPLLRAATTTAVLGINPGNGVKGGAQKCAQLLYQQLVDELAKRAALDSGR